MRRSEREHRGLETEAVGGGRHVVEAHLGGLSSNIQVHPQLGRDAGERKGGLLR